MLPLLTYLQLYLLVVCSGAAGQVFNSKSEDLCRDKGFQCGKFTDIGRYPFWGDTRPPHCGIDSEDFQLKCLHNVTMIKIQSLSYRVQMIDFKTSSLRVARDDLWNTTCPPMHNNTTMDPDVYQFDTTSGDQNITLFFNCTGQQPPNSLTFSCGGAQDQTNSSFNFFSLANASLGGPGPNVTCLDSIYVPMNQTKAQSALASSSVEALQEALDSGFSISWKNVLGFCSKRLGCRSDKPDNSLSDEPESDKAPPPIGSPFPAADKNETTTPGITVPMQDIIIVIPSVVAVTALSTVIIFWCVKWQYQQLGRKQNTNLDRVLLQHGPLALKRYSYSKVKKITKSFTDKLGQGGYGSVYKGMLPNGCHVAVKILGETEGDQEGFINEVASISRTSHVNIVNLLGFCDERNKRALIYEYMPNKSLDKFMRESRSPGAAYSLDLQMLYKIAMGVAKGLEYLHTGCNTRIVHFDIKPQNILLDEDFCPKISDFGLAKLCKKKQSAMSMLGPRGTIGYIAPEIYSRNFGRASYKSDVYSYGMMVLEMVGPRSDMETDDAAIESSETYFPDKIYEQLMIDSARNLDQSNLKARKLLLVGLWCIQTFPSDRPPMSKVVEMLEGSVVSIQIPPKPLLCYPMLSEEELSTSVSMYIETDEKIQLHLNSPNKVKESVF